MGGGGGVQVLRGGIITGSEERYRGWGWGVGGRELQHGIMALHSRKRLNDGDGGGGGGAG